MATLAGWSTTCVLTNSWQHSLLCQPFAAAGACAPISLSQLARELVARELALLQPVSATLMRTFSPGPFSNGCGALALNTSLALTNMRPFVSLSFGGLGQTYRPSLDTFAPRPSAGGGYVACQQPDSTIPPEVSNHADASARMHSDLAALRLHVLALGIDSDYIRVAHAYHSHLEVAHAQSSYASTHLQARGQPELTPTLRT